MTGDGVIPTVITPEQAAGALGITVLELAENISGAVQTRLKRLAEKVRGDQSGDGTEFGDELAGIQRLYESLLECWKIVDATAEREGNAS